ncbi:MAG: hypothetical protein M9963_07845 [Kiritimatiellae bacterium]|nr:hypothetical protein [Kiritimatiellia bacterium]
MSKRCRAQIGLCRTTRYSTAKKISSSSSPAPTWPASPPTSVQVALLVVMAQAGSFVPAAEMLDEIGRGTSTFDGISIAWAVAEYLHNDPRVKAKTLFATHYHELTDLSIALPGVKNYNVLVRETGDRIAFLRRIVPGAADKSYGIQVARLAGLPPEVVARAREILHNLEEGEFEETGQPKLARRYGRKGPDNPNQLRLFDG